MREGDRRRHGRRIVRSSPGGSHRLRRMVPRAELEVVSCFFRGSRPERVAEIAEKRYQLDPDAVLDNIRIARVYNTDDQMDLNVTVAGMLAEDEEPTRLLVRVRSNESVLGDK